MAKAKKKPDAAKSAIPLTKIVNELRSQLVELQANAAEHELQFSLEEIDVELKVGLTAELGGKIGFNCWFYEAEASPNVARENVQTIRVKLKPGKPVRLSRGPKKKRG